MQARMNNPAMIMPDALKAIMALNAVVAKGDVPAKTLGLTHLRASQLNGCAACIELGVRAARRTGEPDDRLHAVAAWRHSQLFTDAERAALALTESVTLLAGDPDPIPDDVWNEAARHYNEAQVAALLLSIGLTNMYNRLNVATRQVPGEWKPPTVS
ncbi:MAG: carboxymuconolactone decarboxylase family protein [Kofleriaceae bacterium]